MKYTYIVRRREVEDDLGENISGLHQLLLSAHNSPVHSRHHMEWTHKLQRTEIGNDG